MRFWASESAGRELLDATGFLPEPTADERQFGSTLAELRDVPCLVLLGSPGLGKTVALKAERSALGPDTASHFVDLGSTRSEDRLEAKVFGSDTYRSWLGGSHELTLFLDSLDEAQARIDTVVDLLMDGLAGAPLERLRLRVACREAERSARLESFLAEGYGPDGYSARRLLPLRRREAHAIADARGVDGAAFIEEVTDHALEPLAASPITLNLLLGVAERQGALPRTRADAYHQGCLVLSGELADRRLVGASNRLTPGQRLAVAGRIAAATILSGRAVVRVTPGTVDVDETTPEELAGGQETDRSTAVPTPFDVGPHEVRDTLTCALFAGAPDRGLTFSHRSYAEYLAATWIAEGALSQDQVSDLLLEEGDRGIFPQLQGLGGWLGALTAETFEWVLAHDPEAVLDTDLGMARPGHRQRIVTAWIQGHAGHGWSRSTADRTMRQLHWPEAVEGLGALLADRTAPIELRIASARLSRSVRFEELEEPLVGVALDAEERPTLRVEALRSLRTVGSDAARRRLVPIAKEGTENDPDDQVQALALYLTWPRVLSTADALAACHPPSSEFEGSYAGFFWRWLPSELDPDDFETALRWAAELPVDCHWIANSCRNHLLYVTSDSLDDPELRELYAGIAAALLEARQKVLGNPTPEFPWPFSRAESRRALIERLIVRAVAGDLDPALIAGEFRLGSSSDRRWVAERVEAARGTPAHGAWRAYRAASEPRRRSSTEAAANEVPAAPAMDADAVPGALAAQPTDPESWFDTGRLPAPERAAYDALRLLGDGAELDPALWRRWTAVLVAVEPEGRDHYPFLTRARARASREAPDEFARWFVRRVERELRSGRTSAVYWANRDGCWNGDVEAGLVRLARDDALDPEARQAVLSQLLRHGSQEGRSVAEDMLDPAALTSERTREMAWRAAVELAPQAADESWWRIWRLVEADDDFGREYLRAQGSRGRHGYVTEKLSVRELGDLFLAMARLFPTAVGQNKSGGFVSNQVMAWSWGVLHGIEEHGGAEAVREFDRLRAACPEHDLVPFYAGLARTKMRREAWAPPAPAEVVRLAREHDLQWVGSDAALRRAVVTSLRRAQAELRGQPPAAEQLWDTRPLRPKHEGALSNWIALFLRRDLAERGIVVAREVQVGAAPAGGRGDSVDLQVDAVAETDAGHVTYTVPIEVKACWHRELEESIEGQLVERYLGAARGHGIYLTFWFGGERWEDAEDERRRRCRGASAEELEERLSAVAREVSARRDVVIEICVLDCSV